MLVDRRKCLILAHFSEFAYQSQQEETKTQWTQCSFLPRKAAEDDITMKFAIGMWECLGHPKFGLWRSESVQTSLEPVQVLCILAGRSTFSKSTTHLLPQTCFALQSIDMPEREEYRIPSEPKILQAEKFRFWNHLSPCMSLQDRFFTHK